MGMGIHGIDVDHADGPDGKMIRGACIRFGDGHEIEVLLVDGRACLRMKGQVTAVTLDASEPNCDFERAVNLLRFYMPELK